MFGGILQLSGDVQFINNSAGVESAIYMVSSAQMIMSKGLQMAFTGNSGK